MQKYFERMWIVISYTYDKKSVLCKKGDKRLIIEFKLFVSLFREMSKDVSGDTMGEQSLLYGHCG